MIADDVILGNNVIIHHPELVNLYGCKIGNYCKIGSFVEIRSGVTIGNNVKIQPFVFIPEGVIIEDGVFIGPHVCFINDKHPEAINGDWEIIPTIVRKRVSIGANATILCGIVLNRNSVIGAGAVVTKDVLPWKTVAGNPAKIIKE